MINSLQKIGNKLAWVQESSSPTDYVHLEILPYQYNELWHAQRHGFLSNFFSIKEPFFMEVQWNVWDIKIWLLVPKKYQEYVTHMFYASFESSELIQKPYNNITKWISHIKWSKDAVLHEPRYFSEAWSYVDPFRDILSFFFTIPKQHSCLFRIQVNFYTPKTLWQKIVSVLIPKKTESEWEKTESPTTEQYVDIWLSFSDPQWVYSNMFLNQLSKFLLNGSVKYSSKKDKTKTTSMAITNLFHLPTKVNVNKSLHYIPYRKLPVPVDLPKDSTEKWFTQIWFADYKDSREPFGMRLEDKFRHMYVIWKTGMGKSNFLATLIRSDIHQWSGVAVLDPHGDLIEDILEHIPPDRMKDVILFDVSDVHHPVWFNILECTHDDQRNLIASWVVSIFKKLYGNSRWPRLEYILRNVMLSILYYPGSTLLHILRMLTDDKFRKEVLTYVKDPIVLKFWHDEFDKRQDRQKNEAIWPIANKIGQFLSSSTVRNIFAQEKSMINIREIMDTGKILLLNLSKGRIWEDSASMIWSFLVTKFQIDAMSRADTAEKDRKDFFLYIDEFQNFATDSFESILSEARKYRLSLIVANQFTSQIEENVRNAIFGNVGTIVSFGVWYDDASMMSQQFKELITANDLLSLPKYKAYIKLMVDGITKDPFTMWTFAMPKSEQEPWTVENIRTQTRQKYAMKRSDLEEKIAWWSKKSFSVTEKAVENIMKENKKKIEQKKKQIIKNPQTTKNSTDKTKKTFTENEEVKNSTSDDLVTIKNIKISHKYIGTVKLKYNYGLFVIVDTVEWLLHKSCIVWKFAENRKSQYEIWDTIEVIAQEIKEIKWEDKIVWALE